MKAETFIVLITVEDAIRLHEMIIARFGGASGVRDMKLLESALDQPLKVIEYGDEVDKEVEYLAATYFFHVINSPYADTIDLLTHYIQKTER